MLERLFRVHGRVQGVGYRWWVRGLARDLGVTGTVRNCSDGTVEVRARGPEDELQRLLQLLRQGPTDARVERVDQEPTTGVPVHGFEITR